MIIGSPETGAHGTPTASYATYMDDETIQKNLNDLTASQFAPEELKAAYSRSEYRCIQSVARYLRPADGPFKIDDFDSFQFGELSDPFQEVFDPFQEPSTSSFVDNPDRSSETSNLFQDFEVESNVLGSVLLYLCLYQGIEIIFLHSLEYFATV